MFHRSPNPGPILAPSGRMVEPRQPADTVYQVITALVVLLLLAMYV